MLSGKFFLSLKRNKIVNIVAYNVSMLLCPTFLYSSIEVVTKCFPNSNQTKKLLFIFINTVELYSAL